MMTKQITRQSTESMGVGKSTLDKWGRQCRQVELEKDILKQALILLCAEKLKSTARSAGYNADAGGQRGLNRLLFILKL